MILILCEETDMSARWAAAVLRLRGHRVKIVTGAELIAAPRWHHRLGQAGVDCEIELAASDRLCASETHGVLNRLPSLPAAWFRRYGGADRDYAVQEMHAFYLSWLYALPGPVLNPPTPQGLCGNWRHPSAWTALAAAAGLPVRPYLQTSDDDPNRPWQQDHAGERVHVVRNRVIGPPSLTEPLGDACLRLAAAAGSPLIGVDFAVGARGRWEFVGASVLPDLIGGGDVLADALAEALAS